MSSSSEDLASAGAPSMSPPPAAKWLDPRDLLPLRGRRLLETEAGLADLFALLARHGPARVPSRRKAAEVARRSVATLKRHFQILAGTTWREFIGRWRTSCARCHLEAPLASEQQIARDCGFSSTGSLTRAFRSRFGMTPREFRASRRPPHARDLDPELTEG
jgi:AraC-like DNA-binding protein